jgi:hypothetical protein
VAGWGFAEASESVGMGGAMTFGHGSQVRFQCRVVQLPARPWRHLLDVEQFPYCAHRQPNLRRWEPPLAVSGGGGVYPELARSAMMIVMVGARPIGARALRCSVVHHAVDA